MAKILKITTLDPIETAADLVAAIINNPESFTLCFGREISLGHTTNLPKVLEKLLQACVIATEKDGNREFVTTLNNLWPRVEVTDGLVLKFSDENNVLVPVIHPQIGIFHSSPREKAILGTFSSHMEVGVNLPPFDPLYFLTALYKDFTVDTVIDPLTESRHYPFYYKGSIVRWKYLRVFVEDVLIEELWSKSAICEMLKNHLHDKRKLLDFRHYHIGNDETTVTLSLKGTILFDEALGEDERKVAFIDELNRAFYLDIGLPW